MTEKEKAVKLIDTFWEAEGSPVLTGTNKKLIKHAIRCSLILVRNMIEEWNEFEFQESGKVTNYYNQEYWRKVESEIKLIQDK